MDLVPETREGFLSRSERTQADGDIIVCVDRNSGYAVTEAAGRWCEPAPLIYQEERRHTVVNDNIHRS